MIGVRSRLRSLTSQHDERFDKVCVTLECLVSQVEEEVFYGGTRFETDYHPIVRRRFQFEIAIDFVELPPGWCDFAEPALAEIPAFVIRRAEPIAPATSEEKASSIPFIKSLVSKCV
jgi:hypothetical protein